MKRIMIMLTRLPSFSSKIISLLTGCRYNHASLALEDGPETFYSFTFKGFRQEHPKGLLKKEHNPFPCSIYTIDVSERAYQNATNMIVDIKTNKEQYHYSTAGLLLSMLHIPFKSRKQFFCSHFVADILERSGALSLRKKSCLYRPGDLQKIKGLSLFFSGTVQGYAQSLA